MSAQESFLKFIMDLESMRKSQSLTQDGIARLLAGTEASTETTESPQGPTMPTQDPSGGETAQAANTPSNR